MADYTTFSIIVPVYNGAETLDCCLSALVAQAYSPELYEIIVVDDGSTDDSVRIAQRYPVRLIKLARNQGRIVARNTGVAAARFETLVFNDARVIAEPNLLAKLARQGYQPILPNVVAYQGERWGFERFFHLLRWKMHGAFYQAEADAEDYYLTDDNFEQRPKGTTLFVVDRTLWQRCQPAASDKMTNDDTRILRAIVRHKPILRAGHITVVYHQRRQPGQVFKHIFERGPRFADYYLQRGGRYHRLYLAIWGMLGLTGLITVFRPKLALRSGVIMLLMTDLAAALYLKRSWSDVIVVGLGLPLIGLAFGLGILKWQFSRLVNLG
ncbi:MAG: glycosyltransferase family 2 protein [Anaerolineae bacterium]|nr:glycosyltransferase family 2 protein [Anaerolineae bacterium]